MGGALCVATTARVVLILVRYNKEEPTVSGKDDMDVRVLLWKREAFNVDCKYMSCWELKRRQHEELYFVPYLHKDHSLGIEIVRNFLILCFLVEFLNLHNITRRLHRKLSLFGI